MEQQVAAISSGSSCRVGRHYQSVTNWRVRLSDCQALNYGLMELCLLGLLTATLSYACQMDGTTEGDLLAVFRYVWMYVVGLHQVPMLLQQGSRLRDILARI